MMQKVAGAWRVMRARFDEASVSVPVYSLPVYVIACFDYFPVFFFSLKK